MKLETDGKPANGRNEFVLFLILTNCDVKTYLFIFKI